MFQCQQPFTDNDVIVLNGNDEDIELLKEKMAIRIASRKTKATKKTKADKIQTETKTATETPSTSTDSKVEKETEKGTEIIEKDEIKKEKDDSTVKTEIDTIPLSIPKFSPNKQTRGHFGSSKRAHPTQLAQDPSYKKTKKEYSIAKDPQSSEVYKSIFTSHKNEKEQQRAHWVTYNPFYN